MATVCPTFRSGLLAKETVCGVAAADSVNDDDDDYDDDDDARLETREKASTRLPSCI